MVVVELRAVQVQDLSALTGGDSQFDDWGPPPAASEPRPARLDANGELAVLADGELAGSVSWHYTEWGPTSGSRCPDIGIWLLRAHRGKGVGAVAQRQLAALFFRHTTVNRVQASTDIENIAEQRALERAGFSREARIRGAQWRRGEYHDMYLYGALRAEFA